MVNTLGRFLSKAGEYIVYGTVLLGGFGGLIIYWEVGGWRAVGLGTLLFPTTWFVSPLVAIFALDTSVQAWWVYGAFATGGVLWMIGGRLVKDEGTA